jgi:hypothetical protein
MPDEHNEPRQVVKARTRFDIPAHTRSQASAVLEPILLEIFGAAFNPPGAREATRKIMPIILDQAATIGHAWALEIATGQEVPLLMEEDLPPAE